MYQIRDPRPVYHRVVDGGTPYVRRSMAMMFLGPVSSAVGLLGVSINLTYDVTAGSDTDRIGNAIFCGPISALMVWVGIACATASLRVDVTGIRVQNPLRRAFIPWKSLGSARVGSFGLRLDTARFSMPVFVAQVSNAARGVPPEFRQVDGLAADLNEIHKALAGADERSAAKDAGAAVKQWRLPLPVLLVVLAYSVAVAFWVYR